MTRHEGTADRGHDRHGATRDGGTRVRGTQLLGGEVRQGGRVIGIVADVRLRRRPDGSLVIAGLLVDRRRRASFFGYYDSSRSGPWLIDRYLRWRERNAFLLDWNDVAECRAGEVVMKPDAARHSPDRRR